LEIEVSGWVSCTEEYFPYVWKCVRVLQEFLQNNRQTSSVAESLVKGEHPTLSSTGVSSINSIPISAATHGFGSSTAHSFSAVQPLYVVTNNVSPRVLSRVSENSEQRSPQTFGDRVRELIVQSMQEDSESGSDSSKNSPPGSLLLASLKTSNTSVTDSSRSQICATPQPPQLRVTVTDDESVAQPPVKRRLFVGPDDTSALHVHNKMAACASVTSGCRTNGFTTYSNGYGCQKESAMESAQASRLQIGHFEQYEDGLSVFADVASRMPTIPANTDGRKQTTAVVGQYLLHLVLQSNLYCQLLVGILNSLLLRSDALMQNGNAERASNESGV
jgi:hypothetical protein